MAVEAIPPRPSRTAWAVCAFYATATAAPFMKFINVNDLGNKSAALAPSPSGVLFRWLYQKVR